MIDVLDRQVELVLVPLRRAAIFGAAVGEDAADRNLVLVEERHHPVAL